jgi:microcin C transport system substrate-binding protein
MIHLRHITMIAATLVGTINLYAETLPKDIKWETNEQDPVFASPEAIKGGEANLGMPLFPLTLRIVGPDANTGALYRPLASQTMGLTGVHPNTEKPIPLLATHWFFAKDKRTAYYKLNPKAKWSDGVPVLAEDFKFTLEFMLSKNIVAPWYNNFYGENFESVIVFDDHTLAIRLKKPKPRIYLFADLPPTPRHFYQNKVDADFVRKFNWSIIPTPGAYHITKVEKGKLITMERIKGWWGEELKYMQNRFNVDRINFRVVRESAVEYEWFKSGKLDFFNAIEPQYWHDREKEAIFAKGYAERLMFYNDSERSAYGIWLNQSNALLKDKNVRLGVQHSMNFDKLIQTQFRKEQVRLNTTCDGFGAYTPPDIKARAFDLKKAGEYFDAAGFKTRGTDGIRVRDGVRLAIALTYASEDWTQRLAVLREEAKKAGLDLSLRFLDWAAAVKQFDSHKHDAALMGFSGGTFPEYWQMWFTKADNNLTSTSIPELDKMILAYNDAADEKTKIKLSHEISAMIHEEASFVPSVARDWARILHWRWWRFPSPPATKKSATLHSFFDMSEGGLLWFDAARYKETTEAQKSAKTFPVSTTIDETYRKK